MFQPFLRFYDEMKEALDYVDVLRRFQPFLRFYVSEKGQGEVLRRSVSTLLEILLNEYDMAYQNTLCTYPSFNPS